MRKRRRRLYWLPMGVIGCAEALFGVALSRVLPLAPTLAVAGVLYVATVQRFNAQMRDRPRPRWITRFVDTPLFWHFGATVLALVLSPLCVVGALLAGLAKGSTLGGVLEFWRGGVGAVYALGLLVSAWAIWVERRFVQIRRLTVNVRDLPAELEGYTIAQLTDLHVGSFDPKERALEWVSLSNALDPDLAVVTGDLVTSGGGFYRDAADAISALRAKDGVFVTMGNHDLHQNDELARLINERGPVVLRNESRLVRRGNAALVVAGMDARQADPADVKRVLRGQPASAPIVLLSHYPTSFEAAVEAGADLVLTGHTHGGQLGIPFFSQRFNFARLTKQRSRGPVYAGKTLMYVNAGLGTTGPPMRLAVPPEIALFTLRRALP
ncbi:MAG TPA: metallophosphoesterase [Polyangiaceae bacterium]|jgi:predicted MPP superfamily phosphohydrolase|nr:metallophosphoesterase [Polyangiaceae bacterium]